ncbi:hypothetical protein [Nocardioides sp. WS12]|uniref:hypothetical protein n=1 Tax=Nocardioides sp. WS12 TaxID=2486272 RepID=UPI0015F994D5|nr:hypothetical protein [Nocardioides sp. WS12]
MSGEQRDPFELAAFLDHAYESWLARLSAEETAAITAWQGTNRHYDKVQSAFRSQEAEVPRGIRAEVRNLRTAIRSAQLPIDLQTWKGIRSVSRVFGVTVSSLLPGTVARYRGFFAVTADRAVATPEFTHPPGPASAAVLQMTWRAGSNLAWIAGAGQRDLRSQYELLAAPGISLRVLAVTYPAGAANVPEISVEVSTS